MWTYSQKTGILTSADFSMRFQCYSGRGEGRNNPAMETVKSTGPIMRGMWKMVGVYDSPNTGPFTIVLEQAPGSPTYGRGDFRIHGDNPAKDASHGCIIRSPKADRMAIWNSGDHDLQVIP